MLDQPLILLKKYFLLPVFWFLGFCDNLNLTPVCSRWCCNYFDKLSSGQLFFFYSYDVGLGEYVVCCIYFLWLVLWFRLVLYLSKLNFCLKKFQQLHHTFSICFLACKFLFAANFLFQKLIQWRSRIEESLFENFVSVSKYIALSFLSSLSLIMSSLYIVLKNVDNIKSGAGPTNISFINNKTWFLQ